MTTSSNESLLNARTDSPEIEIIEDDESKVRKLDFHCIEKRFGYLQSVQIVQIVDHLLIQ